MTILFLSTADTDLVAASALTEPQVRPVNPSRLDAPTSVVGLLDGCTVVVARLLGGRRACPEVLDALLAACQQRGIPTALCAGDAPSDPELLAASTLPPTVVQRIAAHLATGEVVHVAAAMALAQAAATGAPVPELPAPPPPPPVEFPDLHRLHRLRTAPPGVPRIAVVAYHAQLRADDAAVRALCDAVEACGGRAVPVGVPTLRPDAHGRVPAWDALREIGTDVVITTVLAASPAGEDPFGWQPAAHAVPVLQALTPTVDRDTWLTSSTGLPPLDVAMQVAVPEFDGRLVTVPVAFKAADPEHPTVRRWSADGGRADRVAALAVRLARLRHRPPSERRVAIVLSNYPTRHGRIGNGVGLDTPASAVVLLRAMAEAGYDLGPDPTPLLTDGRTLLEVLIRRGAYDERDLTDAQIAAAEVLPTTRYLDWYRTLPEGLRDRIEAHWGPPPGDIHRTDRGLVVAALRAGNVAVVIQPPRGFGADPVAVYHDPDLPPTHHYLATYLWLREEFGADALVHLGKHGTLEWLPGKAVALSAACAPDAALGDLPLVYPFIVNDPGEGTQAKRRAHAVIVDHLVPPLVRAGTYDELAELEALLDEHARCELLDPDKLPAVRARIWSLVTSAGLHRDLGCETPPEDFGEFIAGLDRYLCELKDLDIRGGLHVLGQPPTGPDLVALVRAILRLPHPPWTTLGLRAAVGVALGVDERALLEDPAAPPPVLADGTTHRTGRGALDDLDARATALLAALQREHWDPDRCAPVARASGLEHPQVVANLRLAATEVVPRITAAAGEVSRVLDALAGRAVPAGPAGAPTRGRLDVLPTGKNFHSVDPRALPNEFSWQVGQRLADELIATHIAATGTVPRVVALVVWATANMRTGGDDIAQALALLGVRPCWEPETRRVTGVEVIPLEVLGRPRVDVVLRISGAFRDTFPHLIALFDQAVRLVADLPEPPDLNPLVEAIRRADGPSDRALWRMFGPAPGTYGAGILTAIDQGHWRTAADLATIFTTWSHHAYSAAGPARAEDEFRTLLSRVDAAVKNIDTREHDILDSDDYFQEHGGLIAAITAAKGTAPAAYVGDSTTPDRVRTRTLAAEIARVVRARVLNPKWLDAMRRHGYKGAFELAATVDYLFGFDATTGLVEDWAYEAITQRVLGDAEWRRWLLDDNPWALRDIVERLAEAAARRLWADPSPEAQQLIATTTLLLDERLEAGP